MEETIVQDNVDLFYEVGNPRRTFKQFEHKGDTVYCPQGELFAHTQSMRINLCASHLDLELHQVRKMNKIIMSEIREQLRQKLHSKFKFIIASQVEFSCYNGIRLPPTDHPLRNDPIDDRPILVAIRFGD
jgi:AAA15 family ATPase/GTPase